MSQRLEFAHHLRGIAALLVVLSHYLGVFWDSPEGVARLMGVMPLAYKPIIVPGAEFFIDNKLIFGEFGVGVFFLISGLVIPLSLRRKGFFVFLTERIFRIYPVYIIGFSLTVLAIYLVGKIHGESFPYDASKIFVHYFLVIREWISFPRIDGISWTLEIELKFYLYCALTTPLLRHYPVVFLIVSSLLFFGLSYFLFLDKPTWYIGRQMSALHFMFIGVAFSLFYTEKIKARFFYPFIFISFGLFLFVYMQTWLYRWNADWVIGYGLAFIIFLISYEFRKHFKQNRLLSHFADISYPLYAIHAIVGYAILYTMFKNGFGGWTSILTTSFVVYVISVFIHYFIELPALALGKRLR